MTAIKVPFRLRPSDLSFGEAFQARYQARVDRPIDDLDLNEVFRDVRDSFRPGDWVTFVAYSDNTFTQVREGRSAIITSLRQEVPGGAKVIRAVWHNDYFQVPAEALDAPKNLPPVKLSIKKEFDGGYTVQDQKGHVIERFKSKREAEAYIENLNRKPGDKAAPQEKAA